MNAWSTEREVRTLSRQIIAISWRCRQQRSTLHQETDTMVTVSLGGSRIKLFVDSSCSHPSPLRQSLHPLSFSLSSLPSIPVFRSATRCPRPRTWPQVKAKHLTPKPRPRPRTWPPILRPRTWAPKVKAKDLTPRSRNWPQGQGQGRLQGQGRSASNMITDWNCKDVQYFIDSAFSSILLKLPHEHIRTQELIIEMRNPNVTWRIIWHVYLFTTKLRHTCSDTCTPKYLWSNA